MGDIRNKYKIFVLNLKERGRSEHLVEDESFILKHHSVEVCTLNSSGSVYGLVPGSCEHCNKP
jgi:hypothetical protein